MKSSHYITVNRRGRARLTKRMPYQEAGEVTVMVTLEIPDAAFRNPFAQAHIEVPEGYVIRPDLEVWIEPVEEDEDE